MTCCKLHPQQPSARELCHKITLQHFAKTGSDSRGQPEGTWQDDWTAWAKFASVTGRTAEYAHHFVEYATHVIWLRYRSGVTVDKRFYYNGRYFHIGHVNNIQERNRWLMVICTEAV